MLQMWNLTGRLHLLGEKYNNYTSVYRLLHRPLPLIISDSSWSEDLPFYGQILGITAAGAALVKWGELFLDFPFEPTYTAAAALILVPTAFNAYKWAERSKDPTATIEGML